ncbi:hypothetical protein OG799_11560 [Micromonospora sp. NBC_00898]|nr:hypothetical protein OG799_11560 [Micromonospora sp. NBC_00898]
MTVTVLPGAGHYPWLDDPSAFRAAVDTFLADPLQASTGLAVPLSTCMVR